MYLYANCLCRIFVALLCICELTICISVVYAKSFRKLCNISSISVANDFCVVYNVLTCQSVLVYRDYRALKKMLKKFSQTRFQLFDRRKTILLTVNFRLKIISYNMILIYFYSNVCSEKSASFV